MPLPKLNFPPESNGYTYTSGTEVIENEVEGGKPKRRRDYPNKAAAIQVTWVFDLEEYQYFKAFYNTLLQKGSLPFLIDLIVDNPLPEEYTAYFKAGTLELRDPMGLSIQISATLEIVPHNSTDFDKMVLLLYGQDTFLSLVEQIANYDLDMVP